MVSIILLLNCPIVGKNNLTIEQFSNCTYLLQVAFNHILRLIKITGFLNKLPFLHGKYYYLSNFFIAHGHNIKG